MNLCFDSHYVCSIAVNLHVQCSDRCTERMYQVERGLSFSYIQCWTKLGSQGMAVVRATRLQSLCHVLKLPGQATSAVM